MTARTRTESKYEEENINEFIEATVNFDSNISFFPASKAPAAGDLAGYILVVGNKTQLAETDKLKASLPFWDESVEYAVSEATEGGVYWTNIANKKRLGVAVISETASRLNSPARPDLIITAVTEAVKAAGEKALDIFVRNDDELLVTNVVARATTRPFSAKGGRAEKKYLNETPATRVFLPNAELVKNAEQLKTIANITQVAMRLVDAPPNLLDTTTFPEIASKFAAKMGFEYSVIAGEALREGGWGGMYGVGKAAEFPPALVTLEYKPKGGISNKEKIALVGKGIIYDTGGLSIKYPTTIMSGMKCDMGGAAVVFAGFLCSVALQADREVACVLCLADNAIGPRAQRNDDIVRLKSGLTVEINNTDAEGRLVLSDGVFRASQLEPSMIIDMATLTGAQGIATGKMHAGLVTPTEETERRFVKAGLKSGDLLMPMIYCPEFQNPEFVSKVADHRNLMKNTSNAGSSCAGQFIFNNLKEFSGDKVHVDLAHPTFQAEQATGYGINLLVNVLTQGM